LPVVNNLQDYNLKNINNLRNYSTKDVESVSDIAHEGTMLNFKQPTE
jgi:hypothetical protein